MRKIFSSFYCIYRYRVHITSRRTKKKKLFIISYAYIGNLADCYTYATYTIRLSPINSPLRQHTIAFNVHLYICVLECVSKLKEKKNILTRIPFTQSLKTGSVHRTHRFSANVVHLFYMSACVCVLCV